MLGYPWTLPASRKPAQFPTTNPSLSTCALAGQGAAPYSKEHTWGSCCANLTGALSPGPPLGLWQRLPTPSPPPPHPPSTLEPTCSSSSPKLTPFPLLPRPQSPSLLSPPAPYGVTGQPNHFPNHPSNSLPFSPQIHSFPRSCAFYLLSDQSHPPTPCPQAPPDQAFLYRCCKRLLTDVPVVTLTPCGPVSDHSKWECWRSIGQEPVEARHFPEALLDSVVLGFLCQDQKVLFHLV